MRARQQPGPVVVGVSGLAGSWRIPLVRQIRSDSTFAGHDLPKQPAPLAATGPRLAGHSAGIVRWRWRSAAWRRRRVLVCDDERRAGDIPAPADAQAPSRVL